MEDVLELDLSCWESIFMVIVELDGEVIIGIVGKYVGFFDVYKLLIEVLYYGGIVNGVKVNFKWFDSEQFENDGLVELFEDVYGVFVFGGFGECGVEGKIVVVWFVWECKVLFFGICYGMQMVVIEVV